MLFCLSFFSLIHISTPTPSQTANQKVDDFLIWIIFLFRRITRKKGEKNFGDVWGKINKQLSFHSSFSCWKRKQKKSLLKPLFPLAFRRHSTFFYMCSFNGQTQIPRGKFCYALHINMSFTLERYKSNRLSYVFSNQREKKLSTIKNLWCVTILIVNMFYVHSVFASRLKLECTLV